MTEMQGLLGRAHELGGSDGYKQFIKLCLTAEGIDSYHPLWIPGPLQTFSYALETIKLVRPDLSEDEAVAQARLRTDMGLTVINNTGQQRNHYIAESSLTHMPGDPPTKHKQLGRLHWLITDAGEIIRIVLPERQARLGGIGALDLFDRGKEGQIAHAEGPLGITFSEEPDRIKASKTFFTRLANIALTTEDSANFIQKLQEKPPE